MWSRSSIDPVWAAARTNCSGTTVASVAERLQIAAEERRPLTRASVARSSDWRTSRWPPGSIARRCGRRRSPARGRRASGCAADEMRAPEHHRAGVQRVRRDERDHEAVRPPRQHRPARGEVVGGRAGRARRRSRRRSRARPATGRRRSTRSPPCDPGRALASTTSLTPVTRSPAVVAVIVGRSITSNSPANTRSSPSSRSSASMLVRKPTRPKFTPRRGDARAQVALERAQHRPVAAQHDRQVGAASPSSPTSTPQRGHARAAGRARRRSPRACRAPSRRRARRAARSGAADGICDRSFDIGFMLLRRRVPGRGEIDDVLPVPGWARDTRIAHPEDGRAHRGDEHAEIAQHPPAHLRVADDAAAAPRPFPASNCGFTSTSARHTGSAHASTGGSTSRSEMNETSAVTSSGR